MLASLFGSISSKFFVCFICMIIFYSHLNDMKILRTKRFIPKRLNWVQHWVNRIGQFNTVILPFLLNHRGTNSKVPYFKLYAGCAKSIIFKMTSYLHKTSPLFKPSANALPGVSSSVPHSTCSPITSSIHCFASDSISLSYLALIWRIHKLQWTLRQTA